MSFYQHYVLPRLVHLAMRQAAMLPFRRRIIGAAEGRVLEIGIGSGLNLPLYGSTVRAVIGREPSLELLLMARDRRGEPNGGSHAATTADHGPGPRWSPQQEYRRGPRHQSAHGRDPSRRDHEENRHEISSRASPVGAYRCREWCGQATRPT